jgi:hypothetical protein
MALDSIRFTIRWLESYGVSLGAVSSPTYSLAKRGGEIVSSGYRYQRFVGATGQQVSWPSAVEQVLLTVPVNQTGAGTGNFELVNDTWTVQNGGDLQITLSGVDWAGGFYHPTATGVPLPIEFLSFSGIYESGVVHLTWSTLSETNNFRFVVERRSTPDEAWADVGSVMGQGTQARVHEYQYVDELGLSLRYAEELQYRLKQVDRDGHYSYTAPLKVAMESASSFRLDPNYPNPFRSGTTLQLFVPVDCFLEITATDVIGRMTTLVSRLYVKRGMYQQYIVMDAFPQGVYHYQVTASSSDGTTLFMQRQKMMMMK